MQNDQERIEAATKIANAAMNEIIDLNIDRQTQLLALAELTYRIQGVMERLGAEAVSVQTKASCSTGRSCPDRTATGGG